MDGVCFHYAYSKSDYHYLLKAYVLSDVLSGIVRTTSSSFREEYFMRNVLIPTGVILSGAGLYMALEGHVPALLVTGIIMLFGCGIGIITKKKSE